MRIEDMSALAIAATVPFGVNALPIDLDDMASSDVAEVAAPFKPAQYIYLSVGKAKSYFCKQQYLASSTTEEARLIIQLSDDQINDVTQSSTSELIHEFRRLSGLTWAQVAEIFEVSPRAAFDWAAGKSVSAKNHQRLGEAVAALKFIDRGLAEENRNLLLSGASNGETYFEILKTGHFDLFRELAGEGTGRMSFSREVSADANKFNAPTHFGKALEMQVKADEFDIVPVNRTTARRVKARRKKV